MRKNLTCRPALNTTLVVFGQTEDFKNERAHFSQHLIGVSALRPFVPFPLFAFAAPSPDIFFFFPFSAFAVPV